MFKKLCISSLIITISLGLWAHSVFADTISDAARNAADYIVSQRDGSGSIGGIGFSGWAVQALSATGQPTGATINYLENNIDSIESMSATDVERTILAVIAGNRDPRNFDGKNLVEILKSKASGNQLGSSSQTNDDIFGILALLASGESVTEPVVKGAIQFLAHSQRSDGSFSWSTSGAGDTNNTAAVIQALQLARHRGYTVPVNLDTAVNYLKTAQNSDGGSGYQPGQASDGSSTAWVIHSIIALGEQPESWVKDGKNPYDFLLSLRDEGGGVKWQPTSEPDLFTTSFAAIAFARKSLPVAVILNAPSLSPEPSPIVSPGPTLSPTPSVSPTSVPAPTPSPSVTFTPAVSPLPSPSLVASPSPQLSPTSTPTPSPTPSPILTPISTPTPTPSPSSSPTSTLSPSPTPTPTPSPLLIVSLSEIHNNPAAQSLSTLPNDSQQFQASELQPAIDVSAPTPISPVAKVSPTPASTITLPTPGVGKIEGVGDLNNPESRSALSIAAVFAGLGLISWGIVNFRKRS